MKDMFTPENFFDLSLFSHKALFKDAQYVWEGLKEISKYLKNQKLGVLRGSISTEAHLENPDLISIGIGSVVEPGAYIKGPCIIGNYCTIRHGAYIRGNLITGDHCVIGHATEIKNSIFLDRAQAAHFAYVGDSILGNRTNLGAGCKLANLLFNNSSVKVNVEQGVLDTKLRKFGAIIGDEAQVGCNSVTNPGTFIGKRSSVYPCISVGGLILEDHSVKATNEKISYPQKKHAFS